MYVTTGSVYSWQQVTLGCSFILRHSVESYFRVTDKHADSTTEKQPTCDAGGSDGNSDMCSKYSALQYVYSTCTVHYSACTVEYSTLRCHCLHVTQCHVAYFTTCWTAQIRVIILVTYALLDSHGKLQLWIDPSLQHPTSAPVVVNNPTC